MKDIIHICCSESGRGSLMQAVRQGWIEGKLVISFIDDLSHGPIQWVNEAADTRADWCKKAFPLSMEFEDFSEYVKSSYNKFHEEISKICNEEIIIWYGRNGKEMCGLRYILSFLEDKISQISTIDVSEKTFNENQTNCFIPRWVGELSPKLFKQLLPYKRLMDEHSYIQFMESWKNLKSENAALRIPDGTKVISVSEDYLDNFILQQTETSFRKCARTVGEVLGKSALPVTDDFVFWRILRLIENEKIMFSGKLGVMREMDIKR